MKVKLVFPPATFDIYGNQEPPNFYFLQLCDDVDPVGLDFATIRRYIDTKEVKVAPNDVNIFTRKWEPLYVEQQKADSGKVPS